MARTELPNGIILPAEYSDNWYDDMTSNLSKLDEVIGSDADKLSAEDVGAAALSNDYTDLDNKPDLNPYDQHLANTEIHVTAADKQKWNDNVSQSYVLRYASTSVTPSSTIAYSVLNNTDNIKAGDSVIDSAGQVFLIASVDSVNQTVTVSAVLLTLALDANVMHLTGNETAAGPKTFSEYITSDGSAVGDEFSGNARTNLWLMGNRDDEDVSGILIDTFRQNAAQGTATHIIGFGIKENSVRYEGCRYSWIWDTNLNGYSFSIRPTLQGTNQAVEHNLGLSTDKWDKINGISPGALSLPDLNNGIDISGYITVTGGNKESLYTPPSNGWISVRLARTSGASGVLLIQGNMASSGKNIEVESGTTTADAVLPVTGGVQVSINSALADSIVSAYFYPCQGNV